MSSFSTAAKLGTRPLVVPDCATVSHVTVDINWEDAGAGIAATNVVQIADIPADVEIVDWKIATNDIDSNGTPTVAFTLGYLNAGKTDIGAGTYDAFTAAGGVTAAQTGGVAAPSGATAANCVLAGRGAVRTLGLVATGATATAALTGKKAVVTLALRSGQY